jgi:hypothetical protein
MSECIFVFHGHVQGALQLIHKIQDEMGLRHSDMYRHMSADIAQTRENLQKYVSTGLSEVNGKISTLEERERAIAKQMLDLIETQTAKLMEKMAQNHQEELQGIQKVNDFTTKMKEEQEAADKKMMDAIAVVRKKLGDLSTRDMDHFTSMSARIKAQDEKEARDKDEIIAATLRNVGQMRVNMSEALAQAKAEAVHHIDTQIQGARDTLSALATDAKRTDDSLRQRLITHEQAQRANDAQQQDQIFGLQRQAGSLRDTLHGRLSGLEHNVSLLESMIDVSRERLGREQAESTQHLLALIDDQIASMRTRMEDLEKDGSQNFEQIQQREYALAQALQTAKEDIASQRAADLRDLQGKLESALDQTGNETVRDLDSVRVKFTADIAAAKSHLDAEHTAMKSAEDSNLNDLSNSVAAFKSEQQQANTQLEGQLADRQREFNAWKQELASRTDEFQQQLSAIETAIGAAKTELAHAQDESGRSILAQLENAVHLLAANISETLTAERQRIEGEKRVGLAQSRAAIEAVQGKITGYAEQEQAALEKLGEERVASNSLRSERIESLRERLRSERDATDKSISMLNQQTEQLGNNLTSSKAAWEANEATAKQDTLNLLNAQLNSLTSAIHGTMSDVAKDLASRMSKGWQDTETQIDQVKSEEETTAAGILRQIQTWEKEVAETHRAQQREMQRIKRGADQVHAENGQTLDGINTDISASQQALQRTEAQLRDAVENDQRDLEQYLAAQSTQVSGKLMADVRAANSSVVQSLEEGLKVWHPLSLSLSLSVYRCVQASYIVYVFACGARMA